MAAPGHTPGHIALLDERDATLIAGDAFSTLGGVSTTGRINRRFPLPGMATWDRPTANRTAAMLRTLDPAALAVGHGPVVADPAAAIDRALAVVGADLRHGRLTWASAAGSPERWSSTRRRAWPIRMGSTRSPSAPSPPSWGCARRRSTTTSTASGGLRRDLALRGVGELGERLRDAAVGRAGADALGAVATAYRDYARERPGLYQALQRAPDPGDAELAAAAARLLHPVLAVLAGYGCEGAAAIHAARALRSALHGFVELERLGGFGIDLDIDESYRWMVAALSAGMRARSTAG